MKSHNWAHTSDFARVVGEVKDDEDDEILPSSKKRKRTDKSYSEKEMLKDFDLGEYLLFLWYAESDEVQLNIRVFLSQQLVAATKMSLAKKMTNQ